MAGPHIEAGHLKVVLNDFQVTEAGIYALYAANRYLAAKTRVLIDFLSKRFGATPSWDVF
jgi:DNA-binding transcriptional LysR family regulator